MATRHDQTNTLAGQDDVPTLTAWEWDGLHREFNLADGHAHQSLHATQEEIIRDLPELFRASDAQPQGAYEERFASVFFSLAGQLSAQQIQAPLMHYSSSVATDVVAKGLVAMGRRRIGLLAPTFDNIPLLLRRAGLSLQPLSEAVWESDCSAMFAELDAVFLVLPNNPTGREPTPAEFERVVKAAAAAGIILICDCSFRLYGQLHEWDQYAIVLAHPELDYVFIEDTGKIWPTTDVKVGFLCASPTLYPVLSGITDEILLNVSPFALSLLERFAMVERTTIGGAARFLCANTAETNRSYLRQLLARSPVSIEYPASQISVEWLRLPTPWHSVSLIGWLADKGIGILPGGPFHWEDPEQGRSFIRVALMRDPAHFRRGAHALAAALVTYQP
jgi:aspartate/methionine/tyrosine aminotransferase